MFHFCNWQLWSDKRDWLAWKGLTGEIGKEQIVMELRKEGSKKGRIASLARGSTPSRRAAALQNLELARQAANTPASLEKRTNSIKKGIKTLTPGERKARFSREQTPEMLKSKSEKIRKFKSLTVQTPEGVVTVEGTFSEMAEQLGVSIQSFLALRAKGKIKRLNLRVLSKNSW